METGITEQKREKSFMRVLMEGLIVGYAATSALDQVSIYLYDKESSEERKKENATRGNLHAYERAIKYQTEFFGKKLSRPEIKKWGWRFHRAFGILSGIGYVALRRKFPRMKSGRGLALGTGFFLIVDELMMPLLKLTPGPKAFSLKVHGRGAASHIAYGLAAENTARLLDKFSSFKRL